MLTEREIQILKYLEANREMFITANELAEKIGVSVRTIKSDIKSIKYFLNDEPTIMIKTIRSKGMMLEYTDNNQFNLIIKDNIEKNNFSTNNINNRVVQLMLELLDTKISKVEIQQKFHVSESTVNNDLKNIELLLTKYELKLITNSNNKIEVIGAEQHKRKLISQYKDRQELNKDNILSWIESVVIKILIEEEYNITEQIFNNILIHTQISINRIISGKIITEYDELSEKWDQQVKIARRILKELSGVFHFKVYEAEVVNFSILLAGKSDFRNQSYIPSEISNFADDILIEIDKTFNVNFSDQIENKLNLSLHVIPLLERLKYNVRLPSDQADFVRQTFPRLYIIY